MIMRDMTNKAGWLAGVALGCALATPAALAEEYRGFYFTVWGGSGEYDVAGKAANDEAILDGLDAELAVLPIQPFTQVTLAPEGSTQDDSLTPWGAQIGFRFNKWVAVEAGYVDLGEFLYSMTGTLTGTYGFLCDTCDPAGIYTRPLAGDFQRAKQITSNGITASVLGMFPLSQSFDLHLRGGLYYADTRVTDRLRYMSAEFEDDVFNLYHRRVDASQMELLAGIGGAWNINESFALRVEYQKYFDVGDDEKAGESDVDVINLSVLFK